MVAAAEKAGLQVRYQPVVASLISLEDVLEFKQLYAELPKPILAYCRSGARCANLYQLAQQQDDFNQCLIWARLPLRIVRITLDLFIHHWGRLCLKNPYSY